MKKGIINLFFALTFVVGINGIVYAAEQLTENIVDLIGDSTNSGSGCHYTCGPGEDTVCTVDCPDNKKSYPTYDNYVCGDCNADGVFGMADFVALQNVIHGLSTPVMSTMCDMNRDGNVTFADQVFFMNYISGRGPQPKCIRHTSCTDINGDGAIDQKDLVKLTDIVFLGDSSGNRSIESVDIDGNGFLSSTDVILYSNFLAKLGYPPVCKRMYYPCMDPNHDGRTNQLDLQAIANATFLGPIPTDVSAYDVNGDKELTSVDVVLGLNALYLDIPPTCASGSEPKPEPKPIVQCKTKACRDDVPLPRVRIGGIKDVDVGDGGGIIIDNQPKPNPNDVPLPKIFINPKVKALAVD